MNSMNQPNLAQLQRARTTVPGAKEVLYQPLYDSFTYPAAGLSGTRLFQQAIGGQDNLGRTKTREDTNMQVNGQLPAGWHFLCKGLEVLFYPGLMPGRGSGDTDVPALRPNFVNDVYAFNSRGAAILEISDKKLVNETPLGLFPQQHGITGLAALSDTTTASATNLTTIDYARNTGHMYRVQDITIFNGYNFNVQLDWPNGLLALPSGQPAKVFVRLLGYLYRNA